MKKEPRLLLEKGVNSLVLSIEHFNRPWDQGRTEAVLIFLDHAFEMLLKSAILQRGGRIREPRERQTLGFEACVRKALSEGPIKFLSPEQGLAFQITNSLRDAAQHHLLDLSEQQLYLHAQTGVTLFRDILQVVFGRDLVKSLPRRVLPVSTTPPVDIASLFENEVAQVRILLKPGSRRRVEAYAKLRGLAILEGATRGEKVQPSAGDIRKLGARINVGQTWSRIFPGVAAIEFTSEGYGPSLDLRITKKKGIPIHIVPEGTPGVAIVALKRVNEIGFYNLGLSQLAEKLKLTQPKTLALIRHLDLQSDVECFQTFSFGKATHKRYSQKALDRLKGALPNVSIEDIWAKHSKKGALSKV